MRWSILLLLISLIAGLACGQTVIQTWDFKTDAQGWHSDHSVAPLTVQDGKLLAKATGGDPYITLPEPAFRIEGNDFQVIEITLASDKSGFAEFFWNNFADGADLGFRPNYEMRFQVTGDGTEQVYRIFPGWSGTITRLRLDLLEQATFRIESIRLLQYPVQKSDFKGGRIAFESGAPGFIPTSGIETFATADGKLKLTCKGSVASLLGPMMELDLAEHPILTFRCAAPSARAFVLSYKTADKPGMNSQAALYIPANRDPGPHTYVVDLSRQRGWEGSLRRLQFDVYSNTSGAWPLELELFALGKTALDEPRVELSEVTLGRAVATVGEPFTLSAKLLNPSEQPVREVKLALTDAKGAVLATAEIPGLTAGEERLVPLRVTLSTPAAINATLKATAEGGAGSSCALQLLASKALPEVGAETRPFCKKLDGGLAIGNELVCLVAADNGPRGVYPFELRARKGAGWSTVGTLPWPIELWLPAEKGGFERTSVNPAFGSFTFTESEGQALLSASYKFDFEGNNYTAKLFIRATAGKPYLDYTATLAGLPVAPVGKFGPGPFLAGEGAWGADYANAWFAGLEYLGPGDNSLNLLDAAPPVNELITPHPNRVTMPLMAAASSDGLVAGLMWDPNAKWDRIRNRLSSTFAAPNFLLGQQNTLMQVWAPGIPDYVEENQPLAFKPYITQADRPLAVAIRLFARADSEITQVAADWYNWYGAPALPELPRSYTETLEVSIKSFETLLKVPGKGWRGVLPWEPSKNPGIALCYVQADELLGKQGEYTRKALTELGSGRNAELAARIGPSLAQELRNLRDGALGASRGMNEEGGWTFSPNEDTAALGNKGDEGLGFTARNSWIIWRAARITGDEKLIEAGEKTFRYMERFSVPAASQVWEIPVHAPDILASAQACAAYLEAYKTTGKQEYLEKSVYWARTGLPFVYVWEQQEEGLEPMLYGTIPIFGATFWVGSWYGRLVQWCGLEYSLALLDLAEYDTSLDWRHIAAGIVRSGIRQQRLEPDYYGCYPDSWGMLDKAISWGLMLSPQRIIDNVAALLGNTSDLKTRVVEGAGGKLRLNGAAELSQADLVEGKLTCQVAYTEGYENHLVLSDTRRPTAVLVEGKALPYADDLASSQGSAWTYQPAYAMAEIRLMQPAEVVNLEIQGAGFATPPPPATSWEFAVDASGWTPANGVEFVGMAVGAAQFRITGDDPYLVGPETSFEASSKQLVKVRVKAPTAGPIDLYFTTDTAGFAAGMSLTVEYTNPGEWQELVFPAGTNPNWKGLITRLRLDPPGQVGDVVEVDYVRPD